MNNRDVCWECGRKMSKKMIEYSLYGISMGKFPAIICEHCKEPFFSEETSKRMTEIAKAKGLWGLQAKTKVGQAGKTLDIRLPKRIIAFTNLKKGVEVTITPESKNKIVITV